jgi:hypothetical protein
MKCIGNFKILLSIVSLLFFVQIAAAADICTIVPGTNYCPVHGATSYSYNGIPFEFTILSNGVPVYLLRTYPGTTDTFPMA